MSALVRYKKSFFVMPLKMMKRNKGVANFDVLLFDKPPVKPDLLQLKQGTSSMR